MYTINEMIIIDKYDKPFCDRRWVSIGFKNKVIKKISD